MDIAALSTLSAQANVTSQANILVLKTAIDTSVTQSQDLLNLLPAMAPRFSPAHLGNTIDISA